MSALGSALDAETAELLVDSLTQTPDILRLRLIKARTNLDKARLQLPPSELSLIEDRLLTVEFNITNPEPPAKDEPSKQSHAVDSKPKESLSVMDELNMLYSDFKPEKGAVRHRTNKLDVNSFEQENLSSELVDMAATIKKNALKFQRKLDADSDLVGTTTDAIQRTAGSMTSVGARLQQYRKGSQLGWMFYILSALFIFVSLFVGMALIQLFGKW